MSVAGSPLVAFDPQGMVFAVGIDSRFIRLYDCRGYEKVCYFVDLHVLCNRKPCNVVYLLA